MWVHDLTGLRQKAIELIGTTKRWRCERIKKTFEITRSDWHVVIQCTKVENWQVSLTKDSDQAGVHTNRHSETLQEARY